MKPCGCAQGALLRQSSALSKAAQYQQSTAGSGSATLSQTYRLRRLSSTVGARCLPGLTATHAVAATTPSTIRSMPRQQLGACLSSSVRFLLGGLSHTERITNHVSFHTSPVLRSASRITVTVASATEGDDQDGGALPSPPPREQFTVTTPLYYVNARPHMGSAYPTIAADAVARYQRLQGRPVLFITGTDEHGEKIALAAAANGRSPQEHADLVAQEYRSLWQELDISYDRFIRTTAERHERVVKEFFQRVWAAGDIYRAEYEGLYCVACEEYKDPKELLNETVCPIHRSPCAERKEDNFFFRLTTYQAALEELLQSRPDFVQPSFRRNEVLGWVEEGLRDFSISRSTVDWGIPVPEDPAQTIYVWFDALLGYISAQLDEEVGPESASLDAALARGHWPASVHIIGKVGSVSRCLIGRYGTLCCLPSALDFFEAFQSFMQVSACESVSTFFRTLSRALEDPLTYRQSPALSDMQGDSSCSCPTWHGRCLIRTHLWLMTVEWCRTFKIERVSIS
eukprot:TRINITY_DN4689_c0_g1_i2.p1 TRINITY_DN4689_c0_g1~~TRINITY_DN4689_c0_g1_i2.p1  ORF type:complete len:514 (+),score=54.94 TRINITY_DN4689_c0_g1_i2:298-1839(+)